jgi:hypothetical protein
MVENMYDFIKIEEELTGKKDGGYSMQNLRNVYQCAFELLLKLINQKGFNHKVRTK